MRFLVLLLTLSTAASAQFDTGLPYQSKYRVGKFLTAGGTLLTAHTDGPTVAIGRVWQGAGVMNLVSAELDPQGSGKFEWRKELAPVITMFLAGAANGVAEDLQFHYGEFENTFPNANPEFWNPDLSWRNKYLNGDPGQGPAYFGSTTFLASTTDGYHAAVAARTFLLTTTICISPERRGWKPFLKRTLLYTASYAAGFELMYAGIIR